MTCKYSGKTRASVARSTNVVTDILRMSRKKDDHEIVNYFIANFTSHDDPGSLIGEIIENGETNFKTAKKKPVVVLHFRKRS